MVDMKTPRNVYKSMVLDDSIDAPRDFKQVKNIRYRLGKNKGDQDKKKGNGNIADELLECLSMVDSCEFVQNFSKSKNKLPNIVCYTQNQEEDLTFFLSQKSGNAIGVDRTLNLAHFYVTALVYKNLRVIRKEFAEHPLCVGPIFIHREVTYEYNHFYPSTFCEYNHFYPS